MLKVKKTKQAKRQHAEQEVEVLIEAGLMLDEFYTGHFASEASRRAVNSIWDRIAEITGKPQESSWDDILNAGYDFIGEPELNRWC